MRKRIYSLIGGTALAAAIVAGLPAMATAAPTAAAWPEDCSYGKYSNGSSALCLSGGGQYRAVVICIPWNGGQLITREAPVWRDAGSGIRSIVYCPPQSQYSSSGIAKRQ